MKPVIIIAIAVVCSVVAVLGVLIGLQQISDYQTQAKEKAMQEIEYVENREMCDKLFAYKLPIPATEELNPYQYCVKNDYLSTLEIVINHCATTTSSSGYYELAKALCTQKYSEKLADALKGN